MLEWWNVWSSQLNNISYEDRLARLLSKKQNGHEWSKSKSSFIKIQYLWN